MKPGDLVRHSANIGLLMRRLQYTKDEDCRQNWDGAHAWWVLFVDNSEPTWAYDIELTLVSKGN